MRRLFFVLVSISPFLSGCAGVASSMSALTHPRLSDEGQAEEQKMFASLKTPGTDVDSPVAKAGNDYDRVSGIEYEWQIRENGTVELVGRDPNTQETVTVVAPTEGDVYTLDGHLRSVYNPKTDSCQVVGGDSARGLRCVHVMTRHFFSTHDLPNHPMTDRVKG